MVMGLFVMSEFPLQKYIILNFHSRETILGLKSDKRLEAVIFLSWYSKIGEMMRSERYFDSVRKVLWEHQKPVLTLWKRYFDEKFSREFFVKVPFWWVENRCCFVSSWLSVFYNKRPKFAKFRAKWGSFLKIACIRAENCHFSQHSLVACMIQVASLWRIERILWFTRIAQSAILVSELDVSLIYTSYVNYVT